MPAKIVDGNDVFAVYRAVTEAKARALSGKGPTLIECKTYRTTGHYEGDSQSYRDKDEINAWKQKDPIARCKAALIEANVLTEVDILEMEEQIAADCMRSTEFARNSAYPEPADALLDVYA
jgi:pyruvate dehydrogenase E1 component alpha subunit